MVSELGGQQSACNSIYFWLEGYLRTRQALRNPNFHRLCNANGTHVENNHVCKVLEWSFYRHLQLNV